MDRTHFDIECNRVEFRDNTSSHPIIYNWDSFASFTYYLLSIDQLIVSLFSVCARCITHMSVISCIHRSVAINLESCNEGLEMAVRFGAVVTTVFWLELLCVAVEGMHQATVWLV